MNNNPSQKTGVYFILLIMIITSCDTPKIKKERLAKQYCGSCHLFPEPKLLPKRIWINEVLPNMAFRMGIGDLMEANKYIPNGDIISIIKTLPNEPLVSESDLKLIFDYYSQEAPEELNINHIEINDSINQFKIYPIKGIDKKQPLITLLDFDSIHNQIIYGTRDSHLYFLDTSFIVKNFIKLNSTPSHILIQNKRMEVLQMGFMDPNDRIEGKLSFINSDSVITQIDSLRRPVYFDKADLNDNGNLEYIICEFGNFIGELNIYEENNRKFIKHTISTLPGTRMITINDFNRDGRLDILALITQGDEQLTLFINEGNLKFTPKTLLRFPPVYGSSYFEVHDFNKDGKFDILHVSGDNSDLSIIQKPYHGIRIFVQNENGNFIQNWHYSLPGCTQAIGRDFDQDGDLDIAAISYFANFLQQPESSFVYFENKNGKYQPQTTKHAKSGRWLIMNEFDIDSDNDLDLILGALNFPYGVPTPQFNIWQKENISILLFKNILK